MVVVQVAAAVRGLGVQLLAVLAQQDKEMLGVLTVGRLLHHTQLAVAAVQVTVDRTQTHQTLLMVVLVVQELLLLYQDLQ
jgi:hypothetical protein